MAASQPEEEEMKTIEQRLQSRISRRRNFIRFMEEDAAGLRACRHAVRELDMFPHVVVSLTAKIEEGRSMLKGLADDQKLDKRLKNIVLERAQLYGIRDV